MSHSPQVAPPLAPPEHSIELSAPRKAIAASGAIIIVAVWFYLIATRPDAWGESWSTIGNSTSAIITLVGYGLGTSLVLAAVIPVLPARTIGLIPIAMVLNIVIGQIVGSVGIPLYLDSIGTMLVAALAGPTVGMTTGALNNVVWGLFNPMALPFAAGSAAIGWMAGIAIHRFDAFSHAWRLIVSGVLIGLVSGMIAAPVAAFVYGGTAGVGTGALVAVFREMGNSLLASVTFQSFISDPLDKLVVMAVVYAAYKSLPQKTRSAWAPRSTR